MTLENKWKYSWIFFIFVLVLHFICVCYFSVNVPCWDEWEPLRQGGMTRQFDWNWILSFHTENRHATSQFLTWLFLKFDNWNLKHQIIFNGIMYICSVLIYLRGFQKMLKIKLTDTSLWWFPLVFSLMFSPQMEENHLWGWQANYLFGFFFLTIALWSFSILQQRKAPFVLFASLVLASYSISFALIISLFIAAGVLLHLFFNQFWQDRFRFFNWVLGYLFFSYAIFYWFQGRPPSAEAPSQIQWLEWFKHWLGILSLPIGNHTHTYYLTGLITLCGIAVLIWKIISQLFKKQVSVGNDLASAGLTSQDQVKKNRLPYLCFFAGTLATTLIISLSRHRFGAQQAFASRYFIFAFMLIPFLCFLWLTINDNLVSFAKAKKYSFYISTFIFLGFLNDWSYSAYASTREARLQQRTCLGQHLHTKNVDCPTSYPGDLREMLDRALDLDVEFIQDLKNAN